MAFTKPEWEKYGLSTPREDDVTDSPWHYHNIVASYLENHPEARERYWNFEEHPYPENPDRSYHLMYYDVLKLAEAERREANQHDD